MSNEQNTQLIEQNQDELVMHLMSAYECIELQDLNLGGFGIEQPHVDDVRKAIYKLLERIGEV